MSKEEYMKYKNYIKTLSKPSINELCDNVGIAEDDREILYQVGANRTKTYTCMQLGYSEWVYKETLRRLFIRIDDYLKRTSD